MNEPDRIELATLEAERAVVLKGMASRVAQRARLKDEFEALMSRSIDLGGAIRELKSQAKEGSSDDISGESNKAG